MLHRCTSLAEENQLMRDIKAIQKRGGDHMCSTISLEELDWGVRLYYNSHFVFIDLYAMELY